MISICPHCTKNLNLTETQRAKIENALASLPQGKSLKFNCPHCHKSIEVQREASRPPHQAVQPEMPANKLPFPPGPPDRSWLERVESGRSDVLDDIPQVMILIKDGAIQTDITRFFEEMGYKVVLPHSAAEAEQKMRFTSFASVVLHSTFEGNLASSEIHAHIQSLPMPQRRYIFYVLVGPEFHTLYHLEALSNSANLVINESDIPHFPLILKKGFQDYEELFGPYIAALETMGKK